MISMFSFKKILFNSTLWFLICSSCEKSAENTENLHPYEVWTHELPMKCQKKNSKVS